MGDLVVMTMYMHNYDAHCEGFPPLLRLEVRRRTRLGTVSQNLWGKPGKGGERALPHFQPSTLTC